MTPTYEPNEDPYNDTSPRWVAGINPEDGWYWIMVCTEKPEIAERQNGRWFRSTDYNQSVRTEDVTWWSERIKEPK